MEKTHIIKNNEGIFYFKHAKKEDVDILKRDLRKVHNKKELFLNLELFNNRGLLIDNEHKRLRWLRRVYNKTLKSNKENKVLRVKVSKDNIKQPCVVFEQSEELLL